MKYSELDNVEIIGRARLNPDDEWLRELRKDSIQAPLSEQTIPEASIQELAYERFPTEE